VDVVDTVHSKFKIVQCGIKIHVAQQFYMVPMYPMQSEHSADTESRSDVVQTMDEAIRIQCIHYRKQHLSSVEDVQELLAGSLLGTRLLSGSLSVLSDELLSSKGLCVRVESEENSLVS